MSIILRCIVTSVFIVGTIPLTVAQTREARGTITGKLLADGRPIGDAQVYLQRFKNAECVPLFYSTSPSEKEERRLRDCLQNVSETRPDADGQYRFADLEPGWYAIHMLWNIGEQPTQPVVSKAYGEFVVTHASWKDKTGRYDAMAQGKPVELAPGKDVVLDLVYFRPSKPPAAAKSNAGVGMVSLQDRTWGVVLDLKGFTIKINETKTDGRRYLFAENPTTGVVFSIFLEEVEPSLKNKSCQENQRVRIKESAPYPRKDPKLYQSGEMEVVEYLVPEFQGAHVNQQNLFACAFKDDVYVDIHLSKVRFQPGDEDLFRQILDSFAYREGITRASRDYLQVASLYYAQKNYRKAIRPYSEALALEKQSPQLEKKLWYVLVDNLGMAYGMTGELDKARETFEYGISKDPAYPLFYYNMACYYGEKGDAANAATFLKKAFEYKANTLPGETMPDPRQDNSFKTLLKNPSFRKTLEDILKGS